MSYLVNPGLMALLTDDQPKVTTESHMPGTSPHEFEASLIDSVRNLLNSRWRCPEAALEEVRNRKHTLLNYGVPDFVAMSYNFLEDQEKFFHFIKHTLEQYEPRLKEIQIEKVEQPREQEKRTLAFVLRARLVREPYQLISFNTQWDSTAGRFEIESE